MEAIAEAAAGDDEALGEMSGSATLDALLDLGETEAPASGAGPGQPPLIQRSSPLVAADVGDGPLGDAKSARIAEIQAKIALGQAKLKASLMPLICMATFRVVGMGYVDFSLIDIYLHCCFPSLQGCEPSAVKLHCMQEALRLHPCLLHAGL